MNTVSSNRTDFVRTAIRNQFDRHTDVVRQSVARKTLDTLVSRIMAAATLKRLILAAVLVGTIYVARYWRD
jgi:hypothetical protein